MESLNVLYCGMADDIITPMLLVPDFTTIYVICLLDSAFAKNGTWEGQKNDIKEILLSGSNRNSNHFEVYVKYNRNYKATELEGKSEITQDIDEKSKQLEFTYQGKPRKLIYFHHTDF